MMILYTDKSQIRSVLITSIPKALLPTTSSSYQLNKMPPSSNLQNRHYKLIYFNARGRAELARLILHYAGVDFEDCRIEKSDWMALKPNMPFEQVPVLEVDGHVLAQSHAIARYLARQHGLAGKDEWEQAQVDMYADCVGDLIHAGYAAIREKDADKQHEMMQKFFAESISPNLVKIEAVLAKNNGYLVGKDVTWAEIAYYMFFSHPTAGKYYAEVLKTAPHLKVLMDRIEQHPNIKKYLAVRPATEN